MHTFRKALRIKNFRYQFFTHLQPIIKIMTQAILMLINISQRLRQGSTWVGCQYLRENRNILHIAEMAWIQPSLEYITMHDASAVGDIQRLVYQIGPDPIHWP
ncbi:hypothetical protein PT85_10435 [Pseudomonas flexibilis]|uniref:Uncharacterized protein n=1 Tax=Pseudomonas flexibilis TaxID=706570 RepID=A0A0B3BVB9_9PSED|nr:hypothetical protein PT85_10435 [Pseudomonas flexibilis]